VNLTEGNAMKRNYLFIFLSLVVWSVPIAIGFLAALVWQGLVIGWASCHDLTEKS
jgi:hypothetical protein